MLETIEIGSDRHDIKISLLQYERLKQALLSKSESPIWDDAHKEWRLQYIYEVRGTSSTCDCGKKGIVLIAKYLNRVNGNDATLGSCCSRSMFGHKIVPIRGPLKRLILNITQVKIGIKDKLNIPKSLILASKATRGIDEYELGLLFNTNKKNIHLSRKQQAIRMKLAERIVSNFSKE